jgi:hypothetical protein
MAQKQKTRYSIYPNDTIDEALASRCDATGDDRNRSAMVTAILARYHQMCLRDMPTFAVGEWLCVFTALRGKTTWGDASLVPSSVVSAVRDLIHLADGARQFQLADPEGFLARLARLSYGEAIAVCDAAERFSLAVRGTSVPAEAWDEIAARFVGARHVGSFDPAARIEQLEAELRVLRGEHG